MSLRGHIKAQHGRCFSRPNILVHLALMPASSPQFSLQGIQSVLTMREEDRDSLEETLLFVFLGLISRFCIS